MSRLILAVVALAYAFPAAALPVLAAAVESGSSALWTFLGAYAGGWSATWTRGKGLVREHERSVHGMHGEA